MLWLLITQPTQANENTYPIVLTGGGGLGITTQNTLGGGVSGHAIFQLPSIGIDLGYQEFYYPDMSLMNGGIFMGVRHWQPHGVYIREGLFHQHETPLSVLRTSPLSATFGASAGINHRTGLEVACGILQTQPPSWLPLMAGVDVRGQYFFDKDNPSFYINVDITLGLYVGEKASVIRIR